MLWIYTITGAASGENARKASPKGSQSQAKGQKSNECLFVILMDAEIGDTSLFFYCPYLGSSAEKCFLWTLKASAAVYVRIND